MSIGTIGSTIHTNQQTASVSSLVSNNNSNSTNNLNNLNTIEKNDIKALEIRPTEEILKSNKDKEKNNLNEFKIDVKV